MRISLPQAAEKLGMSPETLRHFLREGKFPFGVAVKRKRWTYYINGEELENYLGRRVGMREWIEIALSFFFLTLTFIALVTIGRILTGGF
jgi:predicted DNA-binding transcriptional regulator AlpA